MVGPEVFNRLITSRIVHPSKLESAIRNIVYWISSFMNRNHRNKLHVTPSVHCRSADQRRILRKIKIKIKIEEQRKKRKIKTEIEDKLNHFKYPNPRLTHRKHPIPFHNSTTPISPIQVHLIQNHSAKFLIIPRSLPCTPWRTQSNSLPPLRPQTSNPLRLRLLHQEIAEFVQNRLPIFTRAKSLLLFVVVPRLDGVKAPE